MKLSAALIELKANDPPEKWAEARDFWWNTHGVPTVAAYQGSELPQSLHGEKGVFVAETSKLASSLACDGVVIACDVYQRPASLDDELKKGTLRIVRKQRCKCIMIVIATNDKEYFRTCRKVWKCYKDSDKDIKVFFAYGKTDVPLEDRDASDLVFDDLAESIAIEKTLRALKYINERYDYDYIVRTNLSTFWDFKHVAGMLERCPKERCYAGGHDLSPFRFMIDHERGFVLTKPLYSGVCIILTPDTVKLMLDNEDKLSTTIADDLALGLLFAEADLNRHTVRPIRHIENCNLLETNIVKEIRECMDKNTIYYRVKNVENREWTDFMIYKNLLAMVYKS